MNALLAFPVARYRFEFSVEQPIRLPDYAGSMLRGAFGHALRQIACLTRAKECTGCRLIGACPYPALFAPQPPVAHDLQAFAQIPVPYVIEPPAWGARVLAAGETFHFHHVLIGRALDELPLIILAWRRALARGVGAAEGTGELLQVVHCAESGDEAIHRPEQGAIADHRRTVDLVASDAASSCATLTFTTPLRLQDNRHALPAARLDARRLLIALARRAHLLAEFHAGAPLIDDFGVLAEACTAIRDEKNLVWRDWTRFSGRQQQAMTLGGVVGTWRLHGSLGPFAALLKLGQWLHVGKETAFGLGQYSLTVGGSKDISPSAAEIGEQPFEVVEKKDRMP